MDNLKEFCTKFDSILMDNLRLVKFLKKEKFDPDDFLFIVDFASLYTLYEHSSSTFN